MVGRAAFEWNLEGIDEKSGKVVRFFWFRCWEGVYDPEAMCIMASSKEDGEIIGFRLCPRHKGVIEVPQQCRK